MGWNNWWIKSKLNLKHQCGGLVCLCDSSDPCILIKGNISVNCTASAGAAANNTGKKVIFKNCAPFTDCISKINNTQVANAKDIDVVMRMYNLIECSDNYSKTSGS